MGTRIVNKILVSKLAFPRLIRMSEEGVEFERGSLHDGFDGFGGSGKHLALLLLVK